MSLDENVFQFNLELDRLLGIGQRHAAPSSPHEPRFQKAMQAASFLASLDFEAEIEPRSGLARRWTQETRKFGSRNPRRGTLNPRFAWISILVIVLLLLTIFHQPVFAAVERLFGYIYVPEMGFLPIRSTLVLQQPVIQEHDGVSLTVAQAVGTSQRTTIILEFSNTASPGDGAFLGINPVSQLPISSWEYVPNTKGSHGLKLIFPPLPERVTQTTLVLPAGWHLPLNWIPADQSSLTDVQAVPYPIQSTGTAIPPNLCMEKNGLKLCLKAATAASNKTSLLMEATTADPAMRPDWEDGLVWQTPTDQVTLQDEQGNTYPMGIGRQPVDGVLLFPPISGTHRLSLTIPSLMAHVDIPDQSITVDLGGDPQPNTAIPVDATIQILGTSVHFSQATLDGPVAGSLQLRLNADEPIQTMDGVTPWMIEIGRPDKINDRYGWGDFGGTEDIHIELIQGGRKVTGQLTIPVISATVLVKGPFVFAFNLADFPAETPTPLVANPDTFQPAPTKTAQSMDSYSYSGTSLQSGDFLYAVWNGDRSQVYRYRPGSGNEPDLFLTLPGNVSSISLHQDLLGMDYLAGEYDTETNTTNPALYTLRFLDPAPRQLYLSLPGGITWPTWSADGRFLAFDYQSPDPGEFQSKIAWIDLTCRDTGNCEIQLLDAPLEYRLGLAQFSPEGDWLAINGADRDYGSGEIYLLQLDQNGNAGPLQNVTNTSHVDDQNVSWISGNRMVWRCIGTTPTDPGNDHQSLCSQEVSSIGTSPKILWENNDYFLFRFSNVGKYFWTYTIDRSVQLGFQLRLHELIGADRLLIEAPVIDMDLGRPVFSIDERWLAYATSEKAKSFADTIRIASTSTGEEVAVFPDVFTLGWLGWVP